MKSIFLLLFSLCGLSIAVHADESIPTIRLTPSDIVQDSIKQVHWTTNTFAVKWRYTEAGGKRMLAFWGQHPGQKVCIQVGGFRTPPFLAPEPLDPVTHSDWQGDWLKRRTDKFMNLSENDAKTIVDAMKGR